MRSYTLKECLERAVGMGFYFVQLTNHPNLYDVRGNDDEWLCFHIELPNYFRKLDGVEPL